MNRYACTKQELSCILGNLFTEIMPPCCPKDNVVVIKGITYSGKEELFLILDDGFAYSGDREDIEKIRDKRCIYERACKQRAFGIECY